MAIGLNYSMPHFKMYRIEIDDIPPQDRIEGSVIRLPDRYELVDGDLRFSDAQALCGLLSVTRVPSAEGLQEGHVMIVQI